MATVVISIEECPTKTYNQLELKEIIQPHIPM